MTSDLPSSPEPPEERFDVVNEQDCVIGSETRSAVHQRKLLHRAVHVFVFRDDGQLLIHRRSATKEEFPSVWTSSCSGHVSAGESYDATAPRELYEELGIAAPVTPLHKFAAAPETSFEFTMLYATRLSSADSVAAITPDPDEIDEIRWMEPAEIHSWMLREPAEFSPAFQLLFFWYLREHVRSIA